MTAVVLGVAGAIVGGIVSGGNPLAIQAGFAAGYAIGNLIDPPKVQGPKIGDTRLQRSTYGAVIPYCWGHGRIGTNVIDQTDLQEHSHSQGGKGGPETTTYTYSASWLAYMCCRLPNRSAAIAGISHIFADGRLIWEMDSGDECPCVVYLGTEDQEPDPTFEAIHGVGNQPAYRGVAYLSFTDYDLSDFGNRIPMIEAVVFTQSTEIPWRMASFSLWGVPLHSNFYHCAATVNGGIITAVEMGNGGDDRFRIRKWRFDGTQIGSMIERTPEYFGAYVSTGSVFTVTNLNVFMRSHNTGFETIYHWLQYDPTDDRIKEVHQPLLGNLMDSPGVYKDGYIFCATNSAGDFYLTRFEAPGGDPGDFVDQVFINNSGFALGLSDVEGDPFVYVLYGDSPNATLERYNAEDLTLDNTWTPAETSSTALSQDSNTLFGVHNDIVAVHDSLGGGNYAIRLTRLVDDSTIEDYGTTIATVALPSISLGSGLFADPVGVYSLNPPASTETLQAVVEDITSLTPIDDHDMSELANDDVRWYVVGTETTARNAIDVLRTPYAFDLVEEDYQIVARKRANQTIVDIPDDDLAARPWGEEAPDPLKTIRTREQELPRNVAMSYIDVDMDWQTNVAASPRQVTLSEFDTKLDVPVGFTAEEAAQRCWTIQCEEWMEREAFAWSKSKKWDKVTPGTWVRVRGRVIRVLRVLQTVDGVLNCDGVASAPSLYTQTAPGTATGGEAQQDPSYPPVPTESVLLDIPILSLNHAPYGFYWAAGPAIPGGPWAGATLFKSTDGGISYYAVASISTSSTIGHAEAYTGISPTVSGTLGDYAGGDVVDESELVVILHNPDLTLTSTNTAGLEAGENLSALRRGQAVGGSPTECEWELLQFRDATLVDTMADGRKVYVLKGFLRGRKGTLPNSHEDGDTFVLMSTAINVDAPQTELNRELLYKAVTVRLTLAETTPQAFTNTGIAGDSWGGDVQGLLPGSFATVVAEVNLPNHRRLVAGSNITLTDGGAGSTLTIAATSGAIEVQSEGVTTVDPTTVVNFEGAGVAVTNDGGGVARITIPGGAGGDDPPYGFPFVFTPPIHGVSPSTFTTSVGSITSITDKNFRLQVVTPNSGSTALRCLLFAAPTPPYTLTICFGVSGVASTGGSSSILGGPVCSDGTKFKAIYAGLSATVPQLFVQPWTNSTAPAAATFTGPAPWVDLARIYLRMTHDGSTHRTYAVSSNGLDWHTVVDESPTVHLTETQIGMSFFNTNTAGALSTKWAIYHLSVTGSVLGDAS